MPTQRMNPITTPFSRVPQKAGNRGSLQADRSSPKRPTMRQLARFDIQLSEIFDGVLRDRFDAFWSVEAELRLEHALPMENFIQSCIPHWTLFEHQKSAYFEDVDADVDADVINEVVSTSVEFVSAGIDIYVRQFIDKDLTEDYFRTSRSFSESRDIAWIVDEASTTDIESNCRLANVIEPNDKIYNFCSPKFTWGQWIRRTRNHRIARQSDYLSRWSRG